MIEFAGEKVKEILGNFSLTEPYTEDDLKGLGLEIEKALYPDGSEDSTVLGFDIYHYSQFPVPQQELVPYLLHSMLDDVKKQVQQNEQRLFTVEPNQALEKFIDVGDGGFFIFENPLQALAVMIIFETELRKFNGSEKTNALRKLLGPISVRYCLTLGKLVHYRNNYYGSALIDNARIISKDRLDRCLIDGATFRWFQTSMNGIENLLDISFKDLLEIVGFTEKDGRSRTRRINNGQSIFETGKMRTVMVQKLEEVEAKNRKLEVFSLYLQSASAAKFITSIGNLNTQGINV